MQVTIFHTPQENKQSVLVDIDGFPDCIFYCILGYVFFLLPDKNIALNTLQYWVTQNLLQIYN